MEDRYLYHAKKIDNGEWVKWNLVQSCGEDVRCKDIECQYYDSDDCSFDKKNKNSEDKL